MRCGQREGRLVALTDWAEMVFVSICQVVYYL